jgi:micrococcal nuclease
MSRDLINDLTKATKQVKKFSFEDYETYAKIVEVYDGDTIKAVFRFNDIMQKFTIRLFGIDTPEIRTRDKLEKRAGYEAKEMLVSLILDKIVYLKLGKFDKYGRILGTIYTLDDKYNIDGDCVNNILIQRGYGEEYYGGKKN